MHRVWVDNTLTILVIIAILVGIGYGIGYSIKDNIPISSDSVTGVR